jgi:hypothetical protein
MEMNIKSGKVLSRALNNHGNKTKGPNVLHLIANFILNYT